MGEAERWAEERRLKELDAFSSPRERDYLVLARLLLARHDPARALKVFDRLDGLAESQGRAGSLIDIRALRSLALQATGDPRAPLLSWNRRWP
jgi:LuxR family maltose regulon positive regulatory protein